MKIAKRVLRPKQTAEYLSISLATLWRLVGSGNFVIKARLSSKAVGFNSEEIDA